MAERVNWREKYDEAVSEQNDTASRLSELTQAVKDLHERAHFGVMMYCEVPACIVGYAAFGEGY